MEIIPGTSVGAIRIGMAADAYEALLGPAVDEFRRTPDAVESVVAYDAHRMHLSIGKDRRVCSITVFRPSQVEFGGIPLLDRNLDSIERDLSQAGIRHDRVDAGIWCAEAGVLLIEVNGMIDGVEVLPIVK